jgi:PAS domain S-box-containing protein
MLVDQPVLKNHFAQLKARLLAGSTLARARILSLVLAVLSAIGVIWPIMMSSHSLTMRVDGALAAAGLAVYWIVGYRRARFPVTGEPIEAIAVYLVLQVAPGHPFLPLCGLLFRCLYGGWPRAMMRWAAWSAALILAGSIDNSHELKSDMSRAIAIAIVPLVMPGLRTVLTRLESSEQRLGSLIEHSTDVVTVLGEDLRVTWQAKSIRAVLGYEVSDWLGTRFSDHVHPDDRAKLAQFIERARDRPDFSGMLELRLRDSDGQVRWFEIAASNRLHDDNVHGYVLNIRDATDRRRLESEQRTRELVQQRSATQRVEIERLRERMEAEREKRELQERLQHAQRLESIGALAGGVAHDFNNLLAIILNYVSFVREDLPEESQARSDVDEIGRAAERGARLTEQLLAFGQRKIGDTEVLDVGEVIGGMHTMLERPLGRHIELRYEPRPELWPIEADRTDVEQIVLNLVVNARDALSDGGSIDVVAENIEVTAAAAVELDVAQGRYLRVSVLDDGCGMDADTLAHVCEPFFTTKPPGEGSGLGLATVYGIARQSGGAVSISSELGAGTRVDVYLPVSTSGAPAAARERRRVSDRVGVGRILLVEDEPAVRDVVQRILVRAGHEATVASSAEQALGLLADDSDFDLLVTDVIMPGMWGDELAERARELLPHLPVLFMSGYSERFLHRGRATAPGPVLTKPFRDEVLLRQVAELVSTNRESGEDETQSDGSPAENSKEKQRRSESGRPGEGAVNEQRTRPAAA